MLFYAKQHARIAVLTMLALVILSNLWASVRAVPLSDRLFFDPLSLILLVLGAILVVSLDSVIYLVNWIVGFHPFLDAFDRAFKLLFGRIGLPEVVTGGLLAALGEETLFRGILQNEIGLIPTTLVFALAHVGRGFNLFALWAIVEGLVFGWLYQLSGNLLVPMVVHGLHDAGGMFFARYLYRRPIPPAATLFDWLHALSAPAALALAVADPASVSAGLAGEREPADDSEASESPDE